MACKLAPNKIPSKVHEEILKNYGEKVADDVFYTMHNEAFRNWFGDWRNLADSLVFNKPYEYDTRAIRIKSNLNNITNPTTNEPILFYTKGKKIPLYNKIEKRSKLARLVEEISKANKDVLADMETFIDENEIVDYAYVVTDKHELGSIPIFIRNNSIVSGDRGILAKYGFGMLKEPDGNYLLLDTADAINAVTGKVINFNKSNIEEAGDRSLINTIVKKLNYKGAANLNLNTGHNFTNGYLEYNPDTIHLQDNIFETLLPNIIQTISEDNPLQFENMMQELVETIEDNQDIVKLVNQLYYDQTEKDNNKEVLVRAIKRLTATSINPIVKSRLESIKRNFLNTLNSTLNGFKINPSISYSFMDLLSDLKTSPITTETALTKVIERRKEYDSIKGQQPSSPRGPMETKADAFFKETLFDDSILLTEDKEMLVSKHSGFPILDHRYIDAITGTPIDYSVSDLKDEFDQLKFDKVKIIKQKINREHFIRTHKGKVSDKNPAFYMYTAFKEDGTIDEEETEAKYKDKKTQLAIAILLGDRSYYFDTYPLSLEIEKLKTNSKYAKKNGESIVKWNERLLTTANSQFEYLWAEIAKNTLDWDLRAFIGSDFHRIFEAVMREEHDREALNEEEVSFRVSKKAGMPKLVSKKDRDLAILAKLDNLENRIEDLIISKTTSKKVVSKTSSYINKKGVPGILEIEETYKGKIIPSNKSQSVEQRLLFLEGQRASMLAGKVATPVIKGEGEVEIEVEVEPTNVVNSNHPFISDLRKLRATFNSLNKMSQLYKDIKSIKAHIHKNGGVIKVETNIKSDKIIIPDGKGARTVAGQIDMLVIYENKQGVPDNYKGTFEIYDYKSMKYWLTGTDANETLYKRMDKDPNNEWATGYTPQKQMEHAFQQLMYARIIEEELGFKFKDAYIIPVSVPQINIATAAMAGNFGIGQTEFGKAEGDHPLVINIKSFKGATFIEEGKKVHYYGHDELRNKTKNMLPSDTDPNVETGTDEDRAQKRINKREADRENDEVLKLIEDIEGYIETTIKNLNKRSKKKSNAKEIRTKLNKLQSELSSFKGIKKIWMFALDASDDILGKVDENKEVISKSLTSVIDEAILFYEQNPNFPGRLEKTIATFEEVRELIDSYQNLLTRIQASINQASPKERKRIQEDKNYKRVEKAIAAINSLEGKFVNYGQNLIAARLANYISEDATESNEMHHAAKRKRLTDYKKEIEGISKTAPDFLKKHYVRKLENISNSLKTLDETEEKLTITKESIIEQLKQLPDDIGIIQRYLLSASGSSDHLLALYAKMLKFEIMSAEKILQQKGVEMQLFVEDLLKNLGLSSIPLNATSFYDPITETQNIWVSIKNEETGEVERVIRPVYGLISKYGTQKHQLSNGEWHDLSHIEIIKDYKFRLKEAADSSYKEYLKLKEKFDSWMRENIEEEFTPEYYEIHDIWTKDPKGQEGIGKKADEKRRKLDDDIGEVMEDLESDFLITEEQEAILKTLRAEKKELANIYVKNTDNLKTGEDLFIAERIQKYNTLYRERHDFNIKYDLFNHKKNEAIDFIQKLYSKKHEDISIPAIETPEYFNWLSKNEEVVHTTEFFNKYHRLKTTRDLMYYSALNNNTAIPLFLHSIKVDRANDIEFAKLLKEFLESKSITLDQIKAEIRKEDKAFELREKINILLAPYKIGLKVDPSLVPEDIKVLVKKYETAIQKEYGKDRAKKKITWQLKDEVEQERLREANRVKKQYQRDLNDFIEYSETNDYWKAYYKEKIKADTEGKVFEKSDWFIRNHYNAYDFKTGNIVKKPISIWTQMQYVKAGLNKVKSSEYKSARQFQVKKLMTKYKNKEPEFYDTKVKESKWYKEHHDEKGELKESSRYFKELSTRDRYTKKQPTAKYLRPTVKDTFIRKNGDIENGVKITIKDEQENLLPKQHKWINNKFEKLKGHSVWFDAHQKLSKMYNEAQAVTARSHQMGTTLPFIQKRIKETIMSEGTIKEKGASLKTFIGEAVLFTSAFDVEEIGEKSLYDQTLDQKNVPMAFTKDFYVEMNQISKDVIGSIMMFQKAAYKYKAIDGVMDETKMLVSLVDKREAKGAGGVLIKDAAGKKYINAIQKGLGRTQYSKEAGKTKAGDLLRDFVEMQVLGKLTSPVEVANPMGAGTFRADKVMNKIMMGASITQIGGVAIGAILKGAANALQAELQVHIERAAGKYYDKKTWRDLFFQWERFASLKDLFKDFGKVASTTLSGQMRDLYDPLQGDFLDRYGKTVPGNKVSKLITSDLWFFNQYLGEFQVAMVSMYALMTGYKIIEEVGEDGKKIGKVYNRTEYLRKRRKEAKIKGQPFGLEEETLAIQEFREIKDNLKDAYELDKEGRVSIKKGVDWTIGSKRDKEMKNRLHAINTGLQGAYAGFDQTVAQKTIKGKLLFMYRKYLMPALRRRFARLERDEQLGDMREGYHRTFAGLIAFETAALVKELLNILARRNVFDTKLGPLERENVRRAAREMIIFIFFGLMLALVLEPDDDEDKDEISDIRWTALYLGARIHREVGALTPLIFGMPQIGIVEDNWRTLKSPSAINSYVDRIFAVLKQLGSPFERYKKKSGIAEKGDLKFYIKLRKLFGQLTLPGLDNTTPRIAYENVIRVQ